ncbi:MAG: hypothetical protein N3D16_11510 [Anaerolineales bacterium]|nr:hypothetical protein [Anaerolineales bacterium]
MARWTSSPKRSPFSVKRLILGIFFISLIFYWDLFRGVAQGFFLFFRLSNENTPLLNELFRYWGSFALGMLLFLFPFSIYLFLTAYFILPNLSLEQHLELWKRLWLYLVGKHGAAVFVRNGKLVEEQGEKSKKGAGMLLIDRQSAVVVEELSRNRSTQVRVFSPGIVFLNPRQKIRGSVDLRPQQRTIHGLRAYTKDGVEILTDLSIVFTLGQAPEVLLVTYDLEQTQNQADADALRVIQFSEPLPSMQNPQMLCRTVSSLSNEIDPDDREEIHRFIQNFHRGTPYHSSQQQERAHGQFVVDPQRIMSAFYAIPPGQSSQTSMGWSDLPLQIAIDLFREFITSIPYASIYSSDHPISHSLGELRSKFSKLIRNQGVLAFQYVHRKDNFPIREGDEWSSAELIFYPVQPLSSVKFLRSKGIKILSATFGELRPADEMIENRLFNQWLAAYQRQLHPSLDSKPISLSPIHENTPPVRVQIANRFAEALSSPTASGEVKLKHLLDILEIELSDPNIKQRVSRETLQRFQTLRSQLTNPQTTIPLDEKT